MKLIAPRVERQVLLAVLERDSVLRHALPKLDRRLFGTKTYRAVFDLLVARIRAGKAIPSAAVMAKEPALDVAARKVLVADEEELVEVNRLSLADVESLIGTLQVYYQKRVLHDLALHVSEELDSTAMPDVDAVVARTQTALTDVYEFSQTSTLKTIGAGGNLSEEYITNMLNPDKGDLIPTGFSPIDDRVKGWRRTNFVALTGMRGHGKSALAKSLGVNMFFSGFNVYTVNLEMAESEYLVRFYAENTPFSHADLRKGLPSRSDIKKIIKRTRSLDAFGEENSCRWTLDTIRTPNFTPEKLHHSLKHQGYDVIIIDYISLMDGGRKELWENIYAITKYLKLMAKDLDALVIGLGQMNDDERAKYAKALEEDSDVWLWWKKIPGDPIVRFRHGKARDYNPFRFDLIFDGARTRFTERSRIKDATWERIVKQEKELQEQIEKQMREELDSEVRAGLRKRSNRTQRSGRSLRSS